MTIPVYFEAAADKRLKLIDSAGNEYYLPKTFEIRSEPAAKKVNLMDVAFAHGVRDVSDGKFQHRIIEISGKIWAATDADYNLAWDELAEMIIQENFAVQDRGRQINILKVQQINHAFPSQLDYRFGEVSIHLLAADPFWYAIAAKTKTFTITSSPYEFQFDVLGNAGCFPTINITNAAANADFKLENESDSDREFRIQDAGALSGTKITVDCAEGLVDRDETDIISKFSGRFLRLLGGQSNRFLYTGANCTLQIQYREAYL